MYLEKTRFEKNICDMLKRTCFLKTKHVFYLNAKHDLHLQSNFKKTGFPASSLLVSQLGGSLAL